MEFDKEAFAAYCKRHKIASGAIVEAYLAEHPREMYHYEDIDAVYQRQVEAAISRREVHSLGEKLAGQGNGKHEMGGWVNSMTYCNRGSRTVNGVGHSDPRYGG